LWVQHFLRVADLSGRRVASGQDNPSTLCIVGDEPSIFDGNLNDHDGPYDGIMMGC
jgi:hypothetical protein